MTKPEEQVPTASSAAEQVGSGPLASRGFRRHGELALHLFPETASLSISPRWAPVMSVITRGTVQTRKGQDRENRGKSFQSQGYLAATKKQKQKSLEGKKMADGSKNPDLILKTFLTLKFL